jgi:tRNA G46 methylase TrmB
MWYSAVNGFEFIKKSSLSKVFYFFPDPWVKKRHYKRRAFSVELLEEIHRVLKPTGKLYLMTDVHEVDEFQMDAMSKHGGFNFAYADDRKWDIKIKTNHEEFCRAKPDATGCAGNDRNFSVQPPHVVSFLVLGETHADAHTRQP